MKKIKNFVVVFVLFSFTFLVFHDVVIETGEFPSYGVVMDEKTKLDTSGEIHKALHLFVALSNVEFDFLAFELPRQHPFSTLCSLTSFKKFVLERPPLA